MVEPESETRCVPLPSCYLEDSCPYPGERTGEKEGEEFKLVGLVGGGDREWQQLGLGQQGPEPSNRPRRGLGQILPAESEVPEGLQVETDF